METLFSFFKQKRVDGERITSEEDIDTLTQINGISIEEIERRAIPISDNTLDTQWKVRSFDGFLGPNETFKGVLKQDWASVKRLNTTPTHLASLLRRILSSVEQKRSSEKLGPMTPITISFTSELSGEEQHLLVGHQLYNGYQYSLFYNDKRKDSAMNTTWNEEYIIKNLKSELEIKVAGTEKNGIIDYIDRFGFFEGGGVSLTLFQHVDSIKGRISKEAVDYVQRKLESQQQSIEDQLGKFKTSMEEVSSKISLSQDMKEKEKLTKDLEWFQTQENKLSNELNSKKQEAHQYLQKLLQFIH